MANFAIASVVIRADGWSADVTLTGEAGAQGAFTYDFGTPGSQATSKFYLSVTSEGYSSAGVLGTVTRTVYGTKAVRKPTPNEANLDETDSGANMVVRVALSDFIYDDDDAGAGGSGADPQVAIAAGWATHTDTDTNTAFLGESATNSSTQDYPKAFGQWATVPFQAFTSNPTLKFTARHRHKISAVKFTLTDASAHAISGFATEVSNQRTASGLYACEHEATLSLTTLTQGEVLTGNAILYPVVGDADSVFDTSTVTVNADGVASGRCNFSFYNNKTGAATVTRYVATTGNDTTGDGLSALTPWLTIQKALTEGSGSDIEVAAGTYTLGAVTAPADLTRWRKVRPASGAAVIVQLDGAEAYNTPHLQFSGVSLTKTVAGAWFDGATGARYLWFDGCTFTDANTGAPTVGPAYRSAACFVTNSTIADAVEWGFGVNFAARLVYWLDGNEILSSAAANLGSVCTRIVANNAQNAYYIRAASGTGPAEDHFVCEFNNLYSCTFAGGLITLYAGATNCTLGCSIVGNIIERTGGTNPNMQISADSSTGSTLHVLLWHNTVAGDRCNLAYNETGIVSTPQLLWSVVGNSMEEYNIKSDLFGTPNANRVGNWACLHGVGYVANGAQNTIGFCNAFEGLYSSGIFGLTEAETGTTPCSPNYTNPGTDNYLPASPSDLIASLPAGWAMVPKDLFGTPIGNVGEGEIGAVQLAPAPTITSIDPTSGAQGATGLDITVLGTELVNGGAATFSGTGITVNSSTWVSATEATVNIDIDGAATADARDLTWTNPDAQAVTSSGAFTVTAASSAGGRTWRARPWRVR